MSFHYLLEDGSGAYILEAGGFYLLENAVPDDITPNVGGRPFNPRIKRETEEEKLKRRIEQGILVEPEPIPEPKPKSTAKLERDIERYAAKIEKYKTKALALEKASEASTEATRLEAQIANLIIQRAEAERQMELARVEEERQADEEALDLMHIAALLDDL